MLVLLIKGTYITGTEMASCGMIQTNFLKTHAGVQEILWFCLRNLRGCNVGITDVRFMN
jgi:hypothetical protein